jgi:uncharacterized protein
MRYSGLLLLLLLCLPLTASALDVPPLRSHVNDLAGMISPQAELRLEQALTEFERSDSTQIALLTIPTLEGESLAEYALKVATTWKLGQKQQDNGALLLVARDERKIRIEVGYGLEGRLTDLLAGRIVDNEISPRFKSGDMDGGFLAGTAAMIEAVRGEYTATTSKKKQRAPWGWLAMVLFLGPGLSLLGGGRRSSSHRRGGFWAGGGGFGGGGFGGGGGFSGGGGGFGGGGASGGW